MIPVLLCVELLAWENHALPTALAIQKMPELNANVMPEPLESFLKAQASGLLAVLNEEERWARQHVSGYPARPEPLRFTDEASDGQTLKNLFLMTIRVNPSVPLELYRQILPNEVSSKALVPIDRISLVPNSLSKSNRRFAPLSKKNGVKAAQVFISAVDEPDYGLDLGLWADSGTPYAQSYQFGPQPFGNPKLEFSSQAPFHMGFFHEWSLMYQVAPSLLRTYPEYRIHMYYTLSRFAFQTGHPYWGWRFAGWGAHYIQDLTQPYHATLLPGVNTARLIAYGILDKLGIEGPKNHLVTRASDEHLALEHKAHEEMLQIFAGRVSPLGQALQQKAPESLRYTHSYVRNNLTSQSHDMSDNLDLTKLMQNFGVHTRAWIRSVAIN
ncbi:MAG: phospholipase [Myxococcota bacterium]